jgi:hypothetical protein
MRGATELLRAARPAWLIELHSPECERAVKEALRGAGYRFSNLEGESIDPGSTLPHHFIAKGS